MKMLHSYWLSTFFIDTQSYTNFLKRLLQDLRKVEIAANSMEKFYGYPSKYDYHKIITGLK